MTQPAEITQFIFGQPLRLHRTRRIRRTYLSTIPRIELAKVSSAGGIIHFDGIVEIVTLYDSPVFCLPSAPATAAWPRRHRSRLTRSGKSRKRIALRERVPECVSFRFLVFAILRLSPIWVDY